MDDKELEAKRELIQILDDVLDEGVWTGSLFLETSGKKIRDLRERLIKGFKLEEQQLISPSTAQSTSVSTTDILPVYIALYQSTGLNLKKWEALLNSINNFSSGRPIYKNEEDVKAFLRSKENQQNDAYALVHISQKDILPAAPNKPLQDRFGHQLLMVKEGAIKPQNIIRFIHITGEYTFKNGALVKKGS